MDPMNPFNTNAPQLTEPPQEPVIDPNAPVVDPNAPPAVSHEDFKKLQDDLVATKQDSNKIISDLNEQVRQSNQLMQAGMANYTPQGAAPIEQITEEQVMEAMNNGEPGAMVLMKKFIQQSSNSEIDNLKTELKTMREQGHQSLAKLARGAGTKDLPYYEKYKEEIESVVNGSEAHLRTDPETYRQAHNFVVGQHMDEIIAQTKEEAIRTAATPQEPGSATTPNRGSSSGRNLEQGTVDLSMENVLSPEALRQLKVMGLSGDEHARRTGFKDFKDFAEYKLKSEGRYAPNEPANA